MVYYYGIQSSGVEAWDRMFKVFQENKVASEKTKLLYGLAAIQEPWALERYDTKYLGLGQKFYNKEKRQKLHDLYYLH